jgi:hypothetical protein
MHQRGIVMNRKLIATVLLAAAGSTGAATPNFLLAWMQPRNSASMRGNIRRW